MSKIRLLPAISALVITFALLFGGYQFYRNMEVFQPLQDHLSKVQYVLQAKVENANQSPSVAIKLGKVKDLQSTYEAIQNTITSTIGYALPVTIVDTRNLALENFYEDMQPILFQGIAQGDYVNMISLLEAQSRKQHINSKITMNSQDIFIQLSKQNAYLYDIVSYSQNGSGVISE